MIRRKSKVLRVGSVSIGGMNPIVVQSMNNTDTRDIEGTLRQISSLKDAGCELTRLAVPDLQAAKALSEITRRSVLPVIADIHFDPRLASVALDQGVAGLRINPGNWPKSVSVAEVAKKAKERQIPIRVGVNAGSLDRALTEKHGGVTAAALAESALMSAALLEEHGFDEICLSVKSSDPRLSVEANRLLAASTDYPLHIGLTEAGTPKEGVIRSAVLLGILLEEGIGDTIRISLTALPEEEIEAAYAVLRALKLRDRGPLLISCPTCGRTEVDLISLAEAVEKHLAGISDPITVAVMGCAVNGPGEAKEADVGVAGGKDEYVIFSRGKVLRKVSESEVLGALTEAIDDFRKRS